RRFRRCEAREVRATSLGGCIAGHNDRPLTSGHHGRCEAPGEVEQAHRVDLEVPIERRRIDLHERSPGAADGIVDQHRRRSHLALHQIQGSIDLRLIRHITDKSLCRRHLSGEIGQPLGRACQHGDTTASRSEAPDERCPRSRTHSTDDANRFRHVNPPHAAERSASTTKSKRSLPKYISSPTNIVGAPKTPRSAAAFVSASSWAIMDPVLARSRSRWASKSALSKTSINTERCERSSGLPQIAAKTAVTYSAPRPSSMATSAPRSSSAKSKDFECGFLAKSTL